MYNINWDEQWAIHAPGFKDGFVVIPGLPQEVRLKAGPGFGDLSHPTTRLVLGMMQRIVPKKVLIDIGCGSGILSCAGAALGAEKVYAVDIDPFALEHTRENARLNKMEIQCLFANGLRGRVTPGCVAVMNMIQSEQEAAWSSLSGVHDCIERMVTSGILAVDEKKYLDLCDSWGFTLQEKATEGEWCAYRLSKSS